MPWSAHRRSVDSEVRGRFWEWRVEAPESGYPGCSGRTLVCDIWGEDEDEPLPRDPVAEADAKLIALAPEMAAAIEEHQVAHSSPGCAICGLAERLAVIRVEAMARPSVTP
jgi:hypothetical protein